MTTNNTGIYRRCGCTRPSGRRWGSACPQLADPKHGSWYYTAQPPTPGGHGRRVRRGGYATAAAARKARALLLRARRGITWSFRVVFLVRGGLCSSIRGGSRGG